MASIFDNIARDVLLDIANFFSNKDHARLKQTSSSLFNALKHDAFHTLKECITSIEKPCVFAVERYKRKYIQSLTTQMHAKIGNSSALHVVSNIVDLSSAVWGGWDTKTWFSMKCCATIEEHDRVVCHRCFVALMPATLSHPPKVYVSDRCAEAQINYFTAQYDLLRGLASFVYNVSIYSTCEQQWEFLGDPVYDGFAARLILPAFSVEP